MAKVLVVEGDANNQDIITRFLKREGYEVIQATDGRAGVEAARSETPDLILMDLNLPLMDGWEATRLIKSEQRLAGIPIVVLTAHAGAEDVKKALAAGCDHYETKPVVYPRLMRKIRAILRQNSPE
jgi:CheY-like chemotaxis protein